MSTLPPTPLVGRNEERAALSAALDAAARGQGGVHFVIGEGGVGKTRLAAAVGEIAAAKGFARTTGRSYPVETGIPYALFADAFLPLLRSFPSSMLQVLARGSTGEFATLFPAFRADGVEAASIAEDEVKPRLLDFFTRFVQRLAQREPQFITLENLHWSDPSSLELLHIIARGAASHRMLLLCTYDDTRREANKTLRATEQSLRSLGALQVHQLAPFTRDETAELVQRQFSVGREAVAGFVDKLHERTRGNAFFVEETIASLVRGGALRPEDGHWVGWNSATLETPRTVKDTIAARLEHLTEPALKVATIGAVIGVQMPHRLLETLAGMSPDDFLASVDELRAERVLVEIDIERQLGYEFGHPLMREVLYEALSRARARSLHGAIAVELERMYGPAAMAHADTLAVHFMRADSPELATFTATYLVAAGQLSLERDANREAAETLDAALALIEQSPRADRDVASVLDLRARAAQRLGDYARASALWTRAIEIATTRGDAQRVAGMCRRLGVVAFWLGSYDDSIAHYNRGLTAAANDEPRTAALLLARSAVLLEVGRADDARADIERALAIAERIGDASLLSRVHHAFQLHAVWRGPAEAARDHGRRAREYANAANDRAAAWNAEWALAVHAGLTGDAPGVTEHYEAACAIAEELRSPVLRLRTDEVAVEYRIGTGAWDEAVLLADQTIADARAFSQRTLLPRLLVWSSILRFGRGDLETGTAHMEEAWKLSGAERAATGAHVNVHAAVPAHVSRAAWHLAKREWPQALAVAEAGIAVADRTGYVTWAVHRLVPIAAEAALYLRDFGRAAQHGARMRADSTTIGHPLGLAWADACFAIIQLLKGDAKGAIGPISRAAEALEAIPFAEHAARVRRVLADAYYESGDTESAVRELRRIHETFARMGAQPALEHVREKFRQLGVRPPSKSVEEGVGALTGREVEIARLVAARKSNKEIASVLNISSRTVGTHLSNIFGKLGVDSRGALTDLVRDGAFGQGGLSAGESQPRA